MDKADRYMNAIIILSEQTGPVSTFVSEQRGSGQVAILEKDELRPKTVLNSLRRLRSLRAENLNVLVRDVTKQHNSFYLKLICFLSGANNSFLRDSQGGVQRVTGASFLLRDLPAFCAALLYMLCIYVSFFCVSVLVYAFGTLRPVRRLDASSVKKLCYLKTDFWFSLGAGGSVTHTKEFINAADGVGYGISVFAPDPLTDYRLNVPVSVIEPSPLLYQLPQLASQLEYTLRFTLVVWRRIRATKPSLIYQRGSMNNMSGALLSVMLDVPLILECNNSLKWEAKNWQKSRFVLTENVCEGINFLVAFKVTVVSDILKRSLVAAGVPERKVIVNPNGVDPVRFSSDLDCPRLREAYPRARHFVGFIGIFGQWHGVLTLAAAVKHVISECPDVQFLIIGDGQLKARMIEILKADGVLDHVSFTGVVAHGEAPNYLSICDVLVSPHEDMEDGSPFFGSPTKIFEYMAMGKGIVASRVGQLGEILENGVNAILVEQKNPKALADGIVTLVREPELRTAIGRQAREKVLTQFTWEQNFRRVVSQVEDSQRPAFPGVAASATSDTAQ
jgi:glycosyltransferase involved in cell wall biosynthesis